jgi:succinate dehydrogenase flavin-adding protein (antitoxin of CptAB toxin-antitoxin module)
MSNVINVGNSGACCDCDCETRPDKVIGSIFLHQCREKIPEKYALYYPHFQDLCRKSENYPAELEQFLSSRDDHIREWISEHRQESEPDFQPMLSARDIVESIFCSNTDTVVKPVVLFSKKGYSSSSGETAK